MSVRLQQQTVIGSDWRDQTKNDRVVPPTYREKSMNSANAALLLSVMAIGFATEAVAQASQDIPIQRDLRREQRLERRLDRNRPPPVDPNVSPDNPDGVVGFDGPPGIPVDNIDSGPLPPGSPADADED
jgi:hypothetical protein